MEEKIFNLMEKMYIEFTGFRKETCERFDKLISINAKFETRLGNLETRFDGLETRFDGLETRFDGLETRFDGLETRFNGLKTGFDGLGTRFDKLETRIENEVVDKIKVLFDARLADREVIDRIEEKVDNISKKVEEHDIQINLLKKAVAME